jgi:hypothetical protein
MTPSGLYIAGELVPVLGVAAHFYGPGDAPSPTPGTVDVYAPGDAPWIKLSPDDCRPRTNAPQQWILHKTRADDPEHILDGAGPAADVGGAEDSAIDWQQDKRHAGSHIIVGYAGAAVCLADLARVCAWHDGNVESNLLSVGLEMKELAGGGCYTATLAATVDITREGMSKLHMQWQCPSHYVNNTPLPRFADGGRTCVGAFGHREVSSSRGRWDPGDVIFDMLAAMGFERFDFYAKQDLDVWAKRQERLRELGYYRGAIDGIPFLETAAALAAAGFPDGIYARGRELAERLAL